MNRSHFADLLMPSYPSRARASRVTEVSREGKAEKDKEESIGTAPACLAGTVVDSVISCKSWSLTFPAFGIFVWWFHCLLIWLALVIFESWQPFLLPAVCLDVCFLADISLSTSSSDNGTFALSLHPVCACHLWILRACFLLTAQEPATWPTLLSWQNSFPTLFAPLLSSLLFPFCFPLSSVPYSLHFPCDSYPPNITLTQQSHCDLQSLACKYLQITKQLPRFPRQSTTWMQPFHCNQHTWTQLYSGGRVRAQNEQKPHPSHKQGSPHRRREPLYARKHRLRAIPTFQASTLRGNSTLFTSLLSSHLYFISALFTSLLSAHLYSLYISTLCTSLLSAHLYSLHISILCTSLVSTHPYFFPISTLCAFSSLLTVSKSLISSHTLVLFTSLFSLHLYFFFSQLYSRHFSTLFVSLFSSHLYFLTSLLFSHL
jgi:hypothetical protein